MPLFAVATALPSIRQDAAEVARQTGVDEAFITDRVGLRTRYILGPEETGVGLGAEACQKLMHARGIPAENIGLLVFVTQTPDRRLPQNSAQLAAALGLSSRVAAFDLALGCSGYVYGLVVVESLLETLGIDTALLVTCDPYSRIVAVEDRATSCIFGDAATASLIRRDLAGHRRGGRLGLVDFGTAGEDGDAISIAAGGAALPFISSTSPDMINIGRDQNRLMMAGRDVFNFVMSRIPDSIVACLDSNRLTISDIDFFALHQGSLYMLDALAKRAGIPRERLLVNIDLYGNTVSSSIPMLLEPGLTDGSLSGKKVLISGFGVGLSWATSIIEFPDEGLSFHP